MSFTEHLLYAGMIQEEEHWEWVLGNLTPSKAVGDLTPGPRAPEPDPSGSCHSCPVVMGEASLGLEIVN